MENETQVVNATPNSTEVTPPVTSDSQVTPPIESNMHADTLTKEEWRSTARSFRGREPEPNNTVIVPGVNDGSSTTESEATKNEVASSTEGKVTPPVGNTEPPEETPAPSPKFIMPDGEELTVEQIQELKKGNMLQSDYTKKTQKLAEDRKAVEKDLEELGNYRKLPVKDAMGLWMALEEDPISTIQYLTEHYQQQGVTDPKDPVVVQLERRIRELEGQLGQVNQSNIVRESQAKIEAVDKYMNELESKYKDEGFDKLAVVNYAIEHGISDPELAWKAMSRDAIATKSKEELERIQREADEKIAALQAQKDQEVKDAVGNYIKNKVVDTANFVPPVGGGGTGASGVSVRKENSWAASRRAAMARISNSR